MFIIENTESFNPVQKLLSKFYNRHIMPFPLYETKH